MLPFTTEAFFGVFETYNQTIWPLQIVLNVLALTIVFWAMRPAQSNRIISGILAVLWLWMGTVYHLVFFTQINKAAYVFSLLFIIQGIVLFLAGVVSGKLSFRVGGGKYSVVGGVFIFYALLIYPILGHFLGHTYPRMPTFGAPCPTTIFTFGMLLWTSRRVPFYVILVPLIWSLIGFSAAIMLGVLEDTGLLVAGIAGTALILWKNRANP